MGLKLKVGLIVGGAITGLFVAQGFLMLDEDIRKNNEVVLHMQQEVLALQDTVTDQQNTITMLIATRKGFNQQVIFRQDYYENEIDKRIQEKFEENSATGNLGVLTGKNSHLEEIE